MYKVKTTFTGYRLGLKDPNLYIGVPHKYFFDRGGNEQMVKVEYQGREEQLLVKDSVMSKTFNDRFTPGKKYTLLYFLWKKIDDGEVDTVKTDEDYQKIKDDGEYEHLTVSDMKWIDENVEG